MFVVYLFSFFFPSFSLKRFPKKDKTAPQDGQFKIHKMDTRHPVFRISSKVWRFKGVGPEDQSRKEITIDLMVTCFWMTTGFDITLSREVWRPRAVGYVILSRDKQSVIVCSHWDTCPARWTNNNLSWLSNNISITRPRSWWDGANLTIRHFLAGASLESAAWKKLCPNNMDQQQLSWFSNNISITRSQSWCLAMGWISRFDTPSQAPLSSPQHGGERS